MKTNKEIELWKKIKELQDKPLISPRELDGVLCKIEMALQRKEEQIREMRESRDGWKKKHNKLKEVFI